MPTTAHHSYADNRWALGINTTNTCSRSESHPPQFQDWEDWCSERTMTFSRSHRKMGFQFRFISLQKLRCLKAITENPHRSTYLTAFSKVAKYTYHSPRNIINSVVGLMFHSRSDHMTWNLNTGSTGIWGNIHIHKYISFFHFHPL